MAKRPKRKTLKDKINAEKELNQELNAMTLCPVCTGTEFDGGVCRNCGNTLKGKQCEA